MSPLAGFLIFIVSITALVIAYLTKQFQEENIIYSNNSQMKNKNLNTKTVEKEKFPVIFRKSYKPEIIVVKQSDRVFYICGLATVEVLNKYQSIDLILSPSLRKRGTKTGFYGFHKLVRPDGIKKYLDNVK